MYFIAETLKNKGNAAYENEEDSETAIQHYLNGVAIFRYYVEEKGDLQTEDNLTFESEAKKKEVKNLINILFLNLSQCYLRLKDFEKSLLTSDQALRIDHKNPKGYFRHAKALEGMNRLETMVAAVDYMEMVVKYSSQADEPHFTKILNEFVGKLEDKKREADEKTTFGSKFVYPGSGDQIYMITKPKVG